MTPRAVPCWIDPRHNHRTCFARAEKEVTDGYVIEGMAIPGTADEIVARVIEAEQAAFGDVLQYREVAEAAIRRALGLPEAT